MNYVWTVLAVYLVLSLFHQNKGKTYGYVIDLLLDLFFGGVIWRKYGVTISSETGLAMRRTVPPKWAVYLNWFLNKIQPGHCEMAIVSDVVRAQGTIAYLEGKP